MNAIALWALVTVALLATGSGWEVLWLMLAFAPVVGAEGHAWARRRQ